mmetsp:Transcript_17022/g.34091  ORF Transcript_17022/g.34091 Transcript_17022/m.34091 type:complete len:247 (+) Transcript_17022:1024-1764(+)
MVQKGAAERLVHERILQRPTEGVLDKARLAVLLGDLPHLLDADAEGLGLDALPQAELLHDLLRAASPGALGKQSLPSPQLHALLISVLLLAVLTNPDVPGRDAADIAVVVIQNLRGREASENLYLHLLGLRPQPPDKLVQTDDVVPVIVELARKQEVGNLDAARLAQRQELVLSHERLERGRVVHLSVVGKELLEGAGLEHVAREDVGPDLRTLLQHADADVLLVLDRKLLEPNRCGEASGAGTNH